MTVAHMRLDAIANVEYLHQPCSAVICSKVIPKWHQDSFFAVRSDQSKPCCVAVGSNEGSEPVFQGHIGQGDEYGLISGDSSRCIHIRGPSVAEEDTGCTLALLSENGEVRCVPEPGSAWDLGRYLILHT
jgi:hypothetical protein